MMPDNPDDPNGPKKQDPEYSGTPANSNIPDRLGRPDESEDIDMSDESDNPDGSDDLDKSGKPIDWKKRSKGYQKLAELNGKIIDLQQKELKETKELQANYKKLYDIYENQKRIIETQKKEISKYSNPGDNIDDMFAESKDDFMFDDIGGLDQILSRVMRVQHGLMYPKMYDCMGIDAPSGIILYGPPGCGKTMITKAMANELGIYFLELNITKFGTKYVNESAGNLASILHACVDKYRQDGKKVLICLDEAEGILSPRGRDSTGELDRCKTVFLNFMDGHEENDGLIFAAATNRYDLIDEAVKRPGRFNETLEVSRPNLQGVKDIFQKQMEYIERQAGRQIYCEIDAAHLARLLHAKDPSGADIRFILEETSHRMIQGWCEADQGDEGWMISPEDALVRQNQLELTINGYEPSSRRNQVSRKIGFGK